MTIRQIPYFARIGIDTDKIIQIVRYDGKRLNIGFRKEYKPGLIGKLFGRKPLRAHKYRKWVNPEINEKSFQDPYVIMHLIDGKTIRIICSTNDESIEVRDIWNKWINNPDLIWNHETEKLVNQTVV